MRFRSAVAVAAGLLVVAGCGDEQSAVAPAPSLAKAAPAQSAPLRHLVVFKVEGAVPSNFGPRVRALGGKVISERSTGIAVVSGLTNGAAATLRRSADISDVEPDVRVEAVPVARMGDIAMAEVGVESPTNPAGAVRYPWQWNYRQVGMETVWASSNPNRFGKSTVKVAILDTGMDPNHMDTQGLVDAQLSRSFVLTDDALLAAHYPNAPAWTDLHGHGTHVGNTVASNAVRVAGMTSMTKLIAVKVLDVNGRGWDTDIFAGLAYAADLDVDVINMSLGSFFQKHHNLGYHRFLSRATKDAYQQGTLIVVSAGNSAINMDKDRDGFKAYCSAHDVVCVSATGPITGDPTTAAGRATFPPGTNFDLLAVYSNSGRHDIDVAAPGGNYNPATLTPEGFVTEGGFIWQACSQTILIPIVEEPVGPGDYIKFGCGNISLLGFIGTSQASPHVAGLAALLAAQMGNNNPGALRARILETADDLGAPGRDPAYGYGRINAARALGISNASIPSIPNP